ncbi:MAG: DUF5615 family PIN-like protein [Gammaproteobacteria bacterium]
MLPVLLDQNFDHTILHGLLRRIPDLDYVTAHQAGISAVDDPTLLRWAANDRRVLLTHDLKTMPGHIAAVIAAGDDVAGAVIVPHNVTLVQAIDELEIIITCSSEDEWVNTYRLLPL